MTRPVTYYVIDKVPSWIRGEVVETILGHFATRSEAEEFFLTQPADCCRISAVVEAASKRKTLDRRGDLIEATIDVLERKSYSTLTVQDVVKQAGVSQGTMFSYFANKEALLLATLSLMEDRYDALMVKNMAAAGDNPVAQIRAYVATDLDETVTTPRMLRAWVAFRSEARDLYRTLAAVNERTDLERILPALEHLSPGSGIILGNLLRALLDGLLRQILMEVIPLAETQKLAEEGLALLLPGHFTRPTPILND